LDEYDLKNKIIAYVKDEGSNLNTITSALQVCCEMWTSRLGREFSQTCFEHDFCKGHQYATSELFLQVCK
jgi:hypothetical protein